MSRKRRRLLALVLGLALLGAATAMVLAAFRDNLVFFYSPSDLAAKSIAPGRRIRIGGLVEQASLKREADGRGRAVGHEHGDGEGGDPLGALLLEDVVLIEEGERAADTGADDDGDPQGIDPRVARA